MLRLILMGLAMAVNLGVAISPEPAAAQAGKGAKSIQVYIGTYTEGSESEGIYRCDLDLATGQLSAPMVAATCRNPSFLALHPAGTHLYAVAEIGELGGEQTGGVAAFARDSKSGKLTLLNEQQSGGSGPCHLVVDEKGSCVLVANYGGGSVSALPLEADGRLKKAGTTIQHQGKSVDPARQEGPHAHSINVAPGNRFALAADLGLDQVLIYRLDKDRGLLSPHKPPFTAVAGGAGPRHFAFHPTGRFGYVINEMANTITAFSWDGREGQLAETQTVTTLPSDFGGTSYTAEVQVHPSGKFVYGSNRGHDSLAVFAVDPTSGKLTSLGQTATGGKTPRNFGIDPTGGWLLAANQDSNTITVFKIDQAKGTLTATGDPVAVPMPVCVKFVDPAHG